MCDIANTLIQKILKRFRISNSFPEQVSQAFDSCICIKRQFTETRQTLQMKVRIVGLTAKQTKLKWDSLENIFPSPGMKVEVLDKLPVIPNPTNNRDSVADEQDGKLDEECLWECS